VLVAVRGESVVWAVVVRSLHESLAAMLRLVRAISPAYRRLGLMPTLKDMDAINPTFGQTDVSIVIGANDIVNPDARTDPSSPIAGMPILDVDRSTSVVVIKRSLSPGFAGIPNPLFAADNALMLFGDAKQAVLDLVAAVKESG